MDLVDQVKETTSSQKPERPPVNRKAECIGRILRRHLSPQLPKKTLVVGCGSGSEAGVLAWMLGSEVVGIDTHVAFNPAATVWAELRFGDATAIDFDDATFDLVYSYHALEHIPRWDKALEEMKRVLRPGGRCCIGTPNRLRVVGYLGSENTRWQEKLLWNYNDWRARLKGRFRNEYGAHAGYSERELRSMLDGVFPSVVNITREYYFELYPRYSGALSALWASGMYSLAVPAVYFLCSAPTASPER